MALSYLSIAQIDENDKYSDVATLDADNLSLETRYG